MLLCTAAYAQETEPLEIFQFAEEYGNGENVRLVYEAAIKGDTSVFTSFLNWAKEEAIQPIRQVIARTSASIAPAFLLAMMRGSLPDGGESGIRFVLRLMLLFAFAENAKQALSAAEECICTAKKFTDAAAPGVTALLASAGMHTMAGLASPAAALAGSIAEGVFLRYGLPLGKAALCVALAGNLSDTIDLNRFASILKKTANWGAGIVTTLFTALIAVQGNISEILDGAGVRAAKFAVDSAAPIIGNGVSDAWEGLISSMMISKNALGISGIAALFFAVICPLAICATGMILLNLLSALLDLFGERETARAAQQIGGVCQMALSLAMGALMVAAVLLGAMMAVGRSFIT